MRLEPVIASHIVWSNLLKTIRPKINEKQKNHTIENYMTKNKDHSIENRTVENYAVENRTIEMKNHAFGNRSVDYY